MRAFLAAIALLTLPQAASAKCADAPDACEIPEGTYHIALPPNASTNTPAVLFLHGAGGTGKGTLNNKSMRETLLARGYALIAPNGLKREGRPSTGWSFHPLFPQRRDEPAFFRAIAADAATRFGIDPTRILLAGFSIGGSMTSYTACNDPTAFAAYAPVAGSFWRPHPTACKAPVKLFHTHGWRDKTVPLEGRPLRNGTIIQGDVFHAMDIWRQTNGCTGLRADRFETDNRFWQRGWDRCTKGSALEFLLHTGAHGVPKGWATKALDWFEKQVPPALN